MTCIVPSPRQPDYSEVSTSSSSGIPGHIGIVKSKVEVWGHDPVYARPHQQLNWIFSESTSKQLSEELSSAQFQIGAVFLRPTFILHDMFVGTKNIVGTELDEDGNSTPVFGLDLVGAPASGVGTNAKSRLPGGEDYENNGFRFVKTATGTSEKQLWNPRVGRDIFYHQLWMYVGSILRRGVPQHPSEYSLDLSELVALRNLQQTSSQLCDFQNWSIEDIQSAVKWNYTILEDNGVKVVSPVQITKPPEDSSISTHWTLEKFTPTWQGEDFIVTIVKGDKRTTDIEDTGQSDCVDTNWETYKYLLYNPATPPDGWVNGISNEAYYIDTTKQTTQASSTSEKNVDPVRKEYWWRYKSYILIEIGVDHPTHNYFIELVKGRYPRFIHVGEEWDHPARLSSAGDTLDIEQFRFIKKSRVLGEFTSLKSDELFKKTDFRFSVRNHLGRFVITFEGYDDNPWVISRSDNDPAKFDFSKIFIPMIVPASRIRIHGGNISAAINWTPTEYLPSVTIPFTDRDADTKTSDSESENDILYMTFSHMGSSIKNTNDRLRRRLFSDPRHGFGRIGYDCDAKIVTEINKNKYIDVNIYESFPNQYRKYGKGWIWEGPSQQTDPNASLEDQVETLYGQHNLKSGMVRGKEHRIKIKNLRTPDRVFAFGLNDDSNASYPYKDYVSLWDVGVELTAGTIELPRPYDNDIDIDPNVKPKIFENYITPIATSWRLVVLGGGKPIQDNVDPFDIAPLIVSMQDSWSAEGFTTINHEMQIRAMIPIGVPTGLEDHTGSELHALGQKLLKLHDKGFYVTISYWWENGVGGRDAIANRIKRREAPNESDLLIQMTGVVLSTTLEKSVNKLYMDIKVHDYMAILKNQLIFNSPFFDGVSDVEAVYELMKLCHFDDNRQASRGIDRRPLGYLQKVIQDSARIGDGKFIYNGEESRCRRYDLPGSYADLANPAVKFQNGETFESAIKKIAQLSSKIAYFDRWGVFRYENIPAIEAAFSSSNRNEFRPVYQFTTTPFTVRSSGAGGDDGTGEISQERFVFDPRKHTAHLVYNVVTYSRSVEDCVNQIILLTASNDIKLADGSTTGGFIVEGYTFFEQIWNPDAEGFLGFRKPFYQSNGIFGGIEGVRNGLLHYAKMKYPPASIQFQTYGVPGLKALDIITLDDNLFYITEISHEIEANTNNWWMNVSGEWLKPFTGSLGFLEERGTTDTGNSPSTP